MSQQGKHGNDTTQPLHPRRTIHRPLFSRASTSSTNRALPAGSKSMEHQRQTGALPTRPLPLTTVQPNKTGTLPLRIRRVYSRQPRSPPSPHSPIDHSRDMAQLYSASFARAIPPLCHPDFVCITQDDTCCALNLHLTHWYTRDRHQRKSLFFFSAGTHGFPLTILAYSSTTAATK